MVNSNTFYLIVICDKRAGRGRVLNLPSMAHFSVLLSSTLFEVSSLGILYMKEIFVDCFVLLGFVPGITWKFFELFYAKGALTKQMLDLGSVSGASN